MPEHAKGKPLEVWFQDEARVGQQGTLTRKWARRGTRPRAPRDTRYKWSYIFGAACPARGTAAGLILPYVNAEAMGLHLNEIAKAVAHGAHAMLIVDGAGWHGAKCLQVPDNITLVKLPPYSPELNPMENVWAYLRSNKLAISVFDTYDEILEKCAQAWNFFANDPQRITSITKRDWIKVNYSGGWYKYFANAIYIAVKLLNSILAINIGSISARTSPRCCKSDTKSPNCCASRWPRSLYRWPIDLSAPVKARLIAVRHISFVRCRKE